MLIVDCITCSRDSNKNYEGQAENCVLVRYNTVVLNVHSGKANVLESKGMLIVKRQRHFALFIYLLSRSMWRYLSSNCRYCLLKSCVVPVYQLFFASKCKC